MSKNTALLLFACTSNGLISLDVSKNVALKTLYCGSTLLTTLDLSKNVALATLNCSSTPLTTLDVSKNVALTHFSCSSTPLTTLDVSKNVALTNLDYSSVPLTTLDLSKNVALINLSCSSTPLTILDLSKNVALTHLYCSSTKLLTLDLSKNVALTTLYCDNNKLRSLNLKNGKNSLMTDLDATLNPLLTCIEVDDANKISTAWKKDATAKYSTECITSTEDALFSRSIILFPNPVSTSLSVRWDGEISHVQLSLFNAQGALVYSQNIGNQVSINVGNFPKGFYFCQIKDKNKLLHTSKIIME